MNFCGVPLRTKTKFSFRGVPFEFCFKSSALPWSEEGRMPYSRNCCNNSCRSWGAWGVKGMRSFFLWNLPDIQRYSLLKFERTWLKPLRYLCPNFSGKWVFEEKKCAFRVSYIQVGHCVMTSPAPKLNGKRELFEEKSERFESAMFK